MICLAFSCDRNHTQVIFPSSYKIPLLDGTKHLLYSLASKLCISYDSIDYSGLIVGSSAENLGWGQKQVDSASTYLSAIFSIEL